MNVLGALRVSGMCQGESEIGAHEPHRKPQDAIPQACLGLRNVSFQGPLPQVTVVHIKVSDHWP